MAAPKDMPAIDRYVGYRDIILEFLKTRRHVTIRIGSVQIAKAAKLKPQYVQKVLTEMRGLGEVVWDHVLGWRLAKAKK